MITRKATTNDAINLAELINMAGDGLPYYLWSKMAEAGESAWDIGCQRAMRDEGAFSYRNAFVVEDRSQVLAALVSYELAEAPDPKVYRDMPVMFIPLQELEDQVPGSWYINVLATYPEYRGKGAGSSLLKLSESLAVEHGKDSLSLIVSNASRDAVRLYLNLGFELVDKRAIIKKDWQTAGSEWTLMTKSVS